MVVTYDSVSGFVEIRNPSLKLYGAEEETILYSYRTAIGQERIKRVHILPYSDGINYFLRKIFRMKEVSRYLESMARQGSESMPPASFEEKIVAKVKEEVLNGRTSYFQSHALANARADFEALRVLLEVDESVKKLKEC